MEEKHVQTTELRIVIDADPASRAGRHADLATATTKGGTTRLDFLLADIPQDDGSMRAVLSSRIFMNNEDLMTLRDTLDNHIASWEVAQDDAAK